MRLIQILVPDDQRETVTETLDAEEIDHVRQRVWANGDDTAQWLIEFPVPTDAIGYALDRLTEAGIETEQYTTIVSLEAAMTPRTEPLLDRFASDFDTLTRLELRTKVRDISHDTRSFLVLIVLSAIVATAGLLTRSPAVVVGSMVIAPIIGPVLTAAVGAVTGDREMLLHSVRIQALGLGSAIVAAALFSTVLQLGGVVPNTTDVSTIDLIAIRSAPGWFTVVIGVASGAAGAFALTTKGSTSLVGVMIAAALIPAAATTGIAAVWNELRLAVGALVLVVLTMILINASAFAVLWRFRYRPQRERWLIPSESSPWLMAVTTGVVLIGLIAVTGAAFYQQSSFQGTVTHEVHATLDDPEYESLEPVVIQTQYSGPGPFGSPETITVVVSRTGTDDGPPAVARTLDRRISEATGHDIVVRVRFENYQYSGE